MSYTTPENLIRKIMAESVAAKNLTPANKTSEEDRVSSALKVLSDNGVTSATKKDDDTISVGAADANKAIEIVNRALSNGVISAKPNFVSAEAIPTPDPTPTPPVFTPEESNPMSSGINDGGVEANGNVTLQKRTLNNRMQNQIKKIDEQQINEISQSKLVKYIHRSVNDEGKRISAIDHLSKAYVANPDKSLNSAGRAQTKKLVNREKGQVLAIGKLARAKGIRIYAKEDTSPAELVKGLIKTQLDEALRIVSTHHSESGKHHAKVYKDTEWGEHRVKFFIHGKHHEPADYHTDDVEDAHQTARSELKRLDKLSGALKEAIAAGTDLEWLDEEYDQLDELSKATLKSYIHKSWDRQDDVDDRISSGERVNRRELKRANNAKSGEELAHSKIKGTARVRATEEVEPLNEISSETRDSWIHSTWKKHLKHIDDKPGQVKEPMSSARAKVFSKALDTATKESLRKHEENRINKVKASTPKVHDLRHMSHGEVYDHTQTSDNINDGDVLHVKGGVAAMVSAWPTMIHGSSKTLHRFKEGSSIHTIDGGAYHKTAKLADSLHSVKEEVEPLNEISKEMLGRYVKRASANLARHTADQYANLASDLGSRKIADKAEKKADKRFKGISKATDKLVKEEQLDEGKMKELKSDLKNLDNGNFKKKYNKPKEHFSSLEGRDSDDK